MLHWAEQHEPIWIKGASRGGSVVLWRFRPSYSIGTGDSAAAVSILPMGKTIIKVDFVSAGLQVTDFTQSVCYDAPGWADSRRRLQTSAP